MRDNKVYDKPIDTTVRTNEENFFTKPQYIGARDADKLSRVIGARRKTDGTIYGTTLPRYEGEIVLCDEVINGEDWVVTYIATSGEFTQRRAWIEIGRRKKLI